MSITGIVPKWQFRKNIFIFSIFQSKKKRNKSLDNQKFFIIFASETAVSETAVSEMTMYKLH